MDTAYPREKAKLVLSPIQQEAVNSVDPFIAVVAGPGSGKTRVLTERICHLVSDIGVDCKSILAVSFSSKAAGEVAKRLKESLGNRASEITVGTFHSFGLAMIRDNASLLGYKDNIEILTPTDRNRIIRKLWENQQKRSYHSTIGIEELISGISMYKGGYNKVTDEVVRYSNEYNRELKLANCVDFDDMILLCRKLLIENDNLRSYYQNRYQHVMVDEVQDMNQYQTDIIQLLIGQGTSLFIVGDDDQCIYEWRGAVPDYLKGLEENSEFHLIHLDDNYRSDGSIVKASSSFIQRNVHRIRKSLRSKKVKQKSTSMATTYAYRLNGKDAEAEFIAKTIQSLVEHGIYRYDDCTILLRKHSQSVPIIESLEILKIPYHMQNEENTQFDEFLAFLRAYAYMTEKNHISRVLNFPTRIIDNFTYQDLCDDYPAMRNMTIFEAIKWLYDEYIAFEDSDIFRSRYRFLADLYSRIPQKTVEEIVKEIYAYYTSAESVTAKTSEKLNKIQSSIALAEDFDATHPNRNNAQKNLISFLDYLSLCAQDDSSEVPYENTVNIMTCHRSKGLEFPVVFIPGVQVSQSREMNAYSFISGYHTSTPELLEAERRLFYVAMTRAIDRLYITCSGDPFIGNGGIIRQGFLAEIPEIVLKRQ